MKKTTVSKVHELPDSLLWAVAVILFLFIPLFYVKVAIDPVLIPRMLVLSIALLLLYVYFFLYRKIQLLDFRLFRLNAILSWLIFIVVSVLSLVKAINPMEGLFDIVRLILMLFLLLAISTILIRKFDLKPFIAVISILAMIYIVIGYYQYFSKAFGKSSLDALYNVRGIWTHKNFFSSMLYLVIPLLVSEVLLSADKKRYLIAAIIFSGLSLIFLLQTRSVWLSVILFILSLAGFLLFFRKKIFSSAEPLNLKKPLFILVSALVLALITSSLVTQLSLNRGKSHSGNKHKPVSSNVNAPEIENIDQRMVSIFDTKDRNVRHRFEMWKMSLKMIRDNPVLGVGAGNWRIVVGDYLTENYNARYFNNIRRPHNDLLWVFSEKGIPGIIAYLSFFIFLLVYVVKVLHSAAGSRQKLLAIIAVSAIAGYFADAMLSFPYERIEHQLMLMFYAALIVALYFSIAPLSEKSDFQLKYVKTAKIVILLLLLGSVLLNRIWLREELYVNVAQMAILKKNWNKAIRNINVASTRFDILEPRNTPAVWFRGTSYVELKEHDKAFEDLKKAYRQNPNSIFVLVDLGVEYGIHGDLDKSVELLQKALKIHPNYESAIKNLAITYYNGQNYKEALHYFIKLDSINSSPELSSIIEDIRKNKLNK